MTGTTGESPVLSLKEKEQMWSEVVKAVNGRVPVIAGTGSYDTKTTLEASKKAVKTGVDGLMVVTPYYNKPPQSDLINHFAAVSEVCDLPIILYNVPSRTGVNMLPDTAAMLCKRDNIVAVKEAAGDLEQLTKLYSMIKEDAIIYSGEDALTLPALAVGATGVISVASHLVGREISQMINKYFSGQVASAKEIHCKLFPIFKELFATTSPIPLKTALNLIGVDVGPLRPPLGQLDEQGIESLKKTLVQLGLK